MTTVYEIPLQYWVGSTDVNGMLAEIGGWHVGCYNEQRAYKAVEYAIARGWAQQRTHHYPDGATSPAYELTDAGLERLRQSWGPKVEASARRAREWYRERVPQN